MENHRCELIRRKNEENSLFLMLNSLLQSRIDTGNETTDDEDVNIYLSLLLHSFLDASFFTDSKGLISPWDTEVVSMAEQAENPRRRYQVYKVNGDNALVYASIFGQPFGAERRTDISEKRIADRERVYYDLASNIYGELRGRESGVSIVLTKLCERFNTYTTILSHAGIEHLKLSGGLSVGELYHLEKQAQEGAIPVIKENGRNQFLDAYGRWMKTNSEEDKETVNSLGRELTKVDPKFKFEGI